MNLIKSSFENLAILLCSIQKHKKNASNSMNIIIGSGRFELLSTDSEKLFMISSNASGLILISSAPIEVYVVWTDHWDVMILLNSGVQDLVSQNIMLIQGVYIWNSSKDPQHSSSEMKKKEEKQNINFKCSMYTANWF